MSVNAALSIGRHDRLMLRLHYIEMRIITSQSEMFNNWIANILIKMSGGGKINFSSYLGSIIIYINNITLQYFMGNSIPSLTETDMAES